MYPSQFLTYPASQYPNPGLNIPAGVHYPDKKVPFPDTPGYPFTTPLVTRFEFCISRRSHGQGGRGVSRGGENSEMMPLAERTKTTLETITVNEIVRP